MTQRMQDWNIHVDNLEANVRIGIYEHEKTPQRICVSALVEATYPLEPAHIGECFNYDVIYMRVTSDWPKRDHTSLLETLALDLMLTIFRASDTVRKASVKITKPDIFSEAKGVGVELVWTRADFSAYTAA